jgi:hypothetical protein
VSDTLKRLLIIGGSIVGLLLVVIGANGCDTGAVSPSGTALAPATATTDLPAATTVEEATAVEEAPATSTSPLATPTGAPAAEAGTGEGNADVLHVRAVQAADGTWTFHVTVEHPDTGWEDYADGWDVVTSDGQVLKPDEGSQFTRTLLHPHENEQPFTRSQSGIVVPEGMTEVRVRAHDLVDGYGGREVVVDLTADSGPNYEVERQ